MINNNKTKILFVSDSTDDPCVSFDSCTKDYDVYSATNSRDAVDQIDAHQMEIVLVDNTLGNESGIGIISALRNLRADVSYVLNVEYVELSFVIEEMYTEDILNFVVCTWEYRLFKKVIDEVDANRKIKSGNKKLSKELKYWKCEGKGICPKINEINEFEKGFLYRLSHEIRTPMNAIVGFSTLLTQRKCDAETTAEYQQYVMENSNQLLKVVDQMGTSYQMSKRMLHIRRSSFYIEELLKEVYYELGTNVDRINMIIDAPFEGEKISINTDKLQLKLIYTSLLQCIQEVGRKGVVLYGVRYLDYDSVKKMNGQVNTEQFNDGKHERMFCFVEYNGIKENVGECLKRFDAGIQAATCNAGVDNEMTKGIRYVRHLINMLDSEIVFSYNDEDKCALYFSIN